MVRLSPSRPGFITRVLAGVCAVAIGVAFLVQPVSAATAGPNLPLAGSNNASIGTVAWASTANITATDTNNASATLGNGATSNYLTATNLGFAIPSGATINGIQVTINRLEGNLSTRAAIQDSSLLLIKGGIIAGTNHASATSWPTVKAAASYGASNDLWGTTLADTDVNASTFGVALAAINVKLSGGGGTESALVDSMTVTITYTAAGGTYSVPSSPAQFLANGTTAIPTGGGSSQEQQVFTAAMTSPNASDTLTLQLEAEPIGTAFTGTATGSSSGVGCSGGTCTSGVTGTITLGGLTPGSYHWQVRTVGGSGSSAWQSYPAVSTNAESATDFAVVVPSGLMRGGKTFFDETQQPACSTGSCQ